MHLAVILLNYTACGNTININFPNLISESETSKLRTVHVYESRRVIPKGVNNIVFIIDNRLLCLFKFRSRLEWLDILLSNKFKVKI